MKKDKENEFFSQFNQGKINQSDYDSFMIYYLSRNDQGLTMKSSEYNSEEGKNQIKKVLESVANFK